MAVNPHHTQTGQTGSTLVSGQCAFVGNAELVTFKSGGDIGVCFGIYVRIDANAHRGCNACRERDLVEYIKLCFAFHIKASDTGLQCLAHFCRSLADT